MAKADGSDLHPKKRQALLALQDELRQAYGLEIPPDILLYRCRLCTGVYPLSLFSRHDNRVCGVRAQCRQCRSQRRNRQRYAPDPHLTEKRCRKCKTTHPVKDFYKVVHQKDGYSNTCRFCESDAKKAIKKTRTWESVQTYRREQTIRLCGLLKIDVPDRDLKYCGHCKGIYVIDDFPLDRARADWRGVHCLHCTH